MIPVLLYHSVNDQSRAGNERWTVSPDVFAQHIEAVVGSGRTAMTVSDYADGLRGFKTLPSRPVLITFDDGFADVVPAARELAAAGIPSTLYVTTDWIGRPGMVTATDILRLRGFNVEIGAHSRTHPSLDELVYSDVWKEVSGAAAELADILGESCRSFAYPHGNHDRSIKRAVADAGYRSACAVKNALSHTADDVYAIARLTVEATTPLARIEAWLGGIGAPQAWSGERVRTRAYRAARRVRAAVGEGSWPGR